jgi:hypothetical protein
MRNSFIKSDEEISIKEWIEDWFCHWDEIDENDTYTMEEAEADFNLFDDKPEGMTVEDLWEGINALLEQYRKENEEE